MLDIKNIKSRSKNKEKFPEFITFAFKRIYSLKELYIFLMLQCNLFFFFEADNAIYLYTKDERQITNPVSTLINTTKLGMERLHWICNIYIYMLPYLARVVGVWILIAAVNSLVSLFGRLVAYVWVAFSFFGW
jgi:hypothetical protein